MIEGIMFRPKSCALSRRGRVDESAEMLLDAIGHGFVGFHRMTRDPDLEALRGHRTYRLLIEKWGEILDARGEAEHRAMRDAMLEEYAHARDDALRINLAAAYGERETARARGDLGRVAAWAEREVFGDLSPADPSRPDPWVSVILPTPEDFIRMVRALRAGGVYDPVRRRLVARDIGPSMRHEFFHVLHWRDMNRRGQEHPIWVQEGLASLVEDVEVVGGSLRVLPSWRTNIVKRLERANRLTAWGELFSMPRERFMKLRPKANYAEARAVLMFLLHEGALRSWYSAYVETFGEDPSGVLAVERALGVPLERAEDRFADWVRELEEVGELHRPGAAGLGLELRPGRGDGPVVDEIVGLRDGRRGLRNRDVILAVDGEATATLDDLHRVLGAREVGDVVVLSVRRGRSRVEVEWELVSTEPEEDVLAPGVPVVR